MIILMALSGEVVGRHRKIGHTLVAHAWAVARYIDVLMRIDSIGGRRQVVLVH